MAVSTLAPRAQGMNQEPRTYGQKGPLKTLKLVKATGLAKKVCGTLWISDS